MSSDYKNALVQRVSSDGGVVRMTTDANGEGLITTSYPCRECYVQAIGSSLSSAMYMNIGKDASAAAVTCVASAATGFRIPVSFGSAVISDAAGTAEAGGIGGPQWITIPIDDVAKLHFASDGASELANILYRR